MTDEDAHRSGLYRWKRQTEPRTYSRSQVTSNNDIENWIKKVEEASNTATDQVFGTNHSSGRVRGKAAILATREQLHEHEQVYNEAQELLSQWMTDKVHLEAGLDNDADDWEQYVAVSDVKQQWDNMLAANYEDLGLPLSSRQHHHTPRKDVYDLDEDEAVSSVLQNMIEKQVVQKKFTSDLGLDKYGKQKDPRNKMELRHKQVKENREKRQQELEMRRRKLQNKKEAQSQAQQLVQQEERMKQLQSRREEMEIRKEMTGIRKQMQEERRRMEEMKARQQQRKEEAFSAAKVKVAWEQQAESRTELEEFRQQEERQRALLEKQQLFQAKLAANNLKTLQRHFSAWYNVVLERRLHMGKARAMSDWKLMLRGWNAWRAYVRDRRLEIESRRHEREIINTQRNKQVAENHRRRKLLEKYWLAWLVWSRSEQDRRQLEQEQHTTRSKMMSLLEAAATGQLAGCHGNQTSAADSSQKKSARNSTRDKEKVANKIDALFEQSRQLPPGGSSADCTDRSEVTSADSHNLVPQSRLPTEAWQVTKKHLNLSPQEIAELGGGEPRARPDNMNSKVLKRFGKQPWMKPEVSNYEHRHATQKNILKEQKRQIKEQQRLIEELQFKATHQELQKQLVEQKLTMQQIAENLPALTQVAQSLEEKVEVKTAGKASAGSGKPRQVSAPQSHKQHPSAATKPDPASTAASTARTTNPPSARTDISQPASFTSTTSEKVKYVTVLKKMEDRAAERARAKAERDEKRRQAEEERLAKLQAEETARLREVEEEKRARVEAYRERKRQEKQRELDRHIREEKIKEMNKMADEHYIKSILKFRGIFCMKKLVAMARENEVKAANHYQKSLMRQVLLGWHASVRAEWREREALADQMRNFLLIKRCFSSWRIYKHHLLILEHRAAKHYSSRIMSKVIQVWSDYANEEKVASWEKERKAKEHYKRLLLRRTFGAWRRVPEEIEREKERERRRNELRQKVAALLPDFEVSKSVDKSFDFGS